MNQPYRVLFLCMGNICRSPAAEGVFQHCVEEAGLGAQIEIDSAGTLGYHAGNPADWRMQAAADRRGYALTSRARQITKADLGTFDLIVAMDRENLAYAEDLARRSPTRADLRLFGEYCSDPSIDEVPDPYYGGGDGFETVLNLLEDGCGRLLESIRPHLSPAP